MFEAFDTNYEEIYLIFLFRFGLTPNQVDELEPEFINRVIEKIVEESHGQP